MKAIKLFIFLIFFSSFLYPLNAGQESFFINSEQTISLDFQDARLKDILKLFSIQSGLNFIASEAVQDRNVTLYLDQVSIKEAMNKLFKANNLSYELDKGSNIFIVKDWGKPQIETISRVFYLKYATVSSSSLKEEMANKISPTASAATSGGTTGGITGATGGGGTTTGKWAIEDETGITQAVKRVLSEYGSVIEDFRTNSLIVTDIPSRMPAIEQTIAALDIRPAQMLLEVEMLDVSKNTVDKMGFKFGSTPMTMVLTGAKVGNLLPFRDTSKLMASEIKMTPGSIDFSTATYTILLDFLKTRSDTKFLARPRILTLNNETAEIKITTQESVGVTTTTEATTGTTSAEPERAETGVLLRVTPQLNPDTQEITMFIFPQVSEAAQGNTLTSSGQTFRFRDPEVRSTKSIVRVKDGETIIVGGLIRNESSQTITKLPILGDLPLLGMFFRHKDKDKSKERELLVFITPHIVKDTAELAKVENIAGLPEREQTATLGVDRQAVISASLNNLERKKR